MISLTTMARSTCPWLTAGLTDSLSGDWSSLKIHVAFQWRFYRSSENAGEAPVNQTESLDSDIFRTNNHVTCTFWKKMREQLIDE